MVAATVFHAKTATAPDDPTYNILPSDWNSSHTVSVMLQAGDFANSNNVTFGVNTAGVVTASAAGGGAGQTGISGIAAAGGTATSGTVSFANGSGVSWSLNGQTLGASVKTDYQTSGVYLTTAALSQDSSKYAGINFAGTNITGTLNTSGLSLSVAAAPAATSLSFANSNGVSWGIAGSTITATVATNYQSSGAYLTTAALSQDSSKYAGINGAITGGSITVNTSGVSVNLPAYLTTARASTDAIGLNTAGTNITWTANSSGLSINAAGYAGTTTAITGAASITLNSAGLNFNIGAYLTTADQSGNSSNYARNWKLTGNSAGTQSSAIGTDLWLAGGQGITLSGSSNSISFSVGSYITTADLSANSSNYARNWKLTGNSAGTQSSAIGTDLWLAGGQGITLSGSSNSISFSIGSYITTARASTDAVGLNTANTNVTWTVNSSGISINAAGYAGTGTSATNASVTLNSNGLAISVAAPGGGGVTISSYENGLFANTSSMSFNGASVSHAAAFLLPQAGSFSFLRIPVAMNTGAGTVAANASLTSGGGFIYSTWNAVVYSLGTGANSQSLRSVASASAGWTQQNSYSAGGGANSTLWSISQFVTARAYGSTITVSTQYSQTSASVSFSTGYFTNLTGTRMFDIDFANSLAAGAYWLVVGYTSSATTSGQGGAALSNARLSYQGHYGMTQIASAFPAFGETGIVFPAFGAGSFSTVGGGTTNSIPLSNITTFSNNNRLYFQLLASA